MDIPLQLIVLSTPSLIYLVVRRRRGDEWREILKKLGWRGAPLITFLWSLGIVLVLGAAGWLAFQQVPPEILEDPNINISAYAGMTLTVSSFALVWLREALYVALGEEILFRGLLGGWLFRKLGFAAGNAVQALAFLLPHLILLLISLDLWPIIVVQAVAGWLLGWLRYRSDSILPGWFAHSLINALGALAAMG